MDLLVSVVSIPFFYCFLGNESQPLCIESYFPSTKNRQFAAAMYFNAESNIQERFMLVICRDNILISSFQSDSLHLSQFILAVHWNTAAPVTSSEAIPTTWSRYKFTIHYSFIQKSIPYTVSEHRKICICMAKCQTGFATARNDNFNFILT